MLNSFPVHQNCSLSAFRCLGCCPLCASRTHLQTIVWCAHSIFILRLDLWRFRRNELLTWSTKECRRHNLCCFLIFLPNSMRCRRRTHLFPRKYWWCCRKNGKNERIDSKYNSHKRHENKKVKRKLRAKATAWIDDEEKQQHFALRKSMRKKKSNVNATDGMPQVHKKIPNWHSSEHKRETKRRTSAINEATLLFGGEKRKNYVNEWQTRDETHRVNKNSECVADAGKVKTSDDDDETLNRHRVLSQNMARKQIHTHKSFLLFFFSVYCITIGITYATLFDAGGFAARHSKSQCQHSDAFPMIFQPDSVYLFRLPSMLCVRHKSGLNVCVRCTQTK